VRVGKEGRDTPLWCEPLPPKPWNGGRYPWSKYISASKYFRKEGCAYRENLPGQCFGLGPERVNSTKGILSAEECAAGCCQEPNCIVWQQLPERGCFYNKQRLKKYPHCDQYKGAYIGGRKKET